MEGKGLGQELLDGVLGAKKALGYVYQAQKK